MPASAQADPAIAISKWARAPMRPPLVEDDRKADRVLSREFVEEGFVVDLAHSGEVGDEMATSNPYVAIVLDWLLPRKGGPAVCRGFRHKLGYYASRG